MGLTELPNWGVPEPLLLLLLCMSARQMYIMC